MNEIRIPSDHRHECRPSHKRRREIAHDTFSIDVAVPGSDKADEIREKYRQFRRLQLDVREWIPLAEIAEWYSELSGKVPPDPADLDAAYRLLLRDLLDGDFESNGKSMVLRHGPDGGPWFIRRGMTESIADTNWCSAEAVLADYWISEEMFRSWRAKHNLEQDPPRFRPRRDRPVVTAAAPDEALASPGFKETIATIGAEKRATRALVAVFKANKAATKAEAYKVCAPFGFAGPTSRGFMRAWRAAREQVGLPREALPGRPKSKR